MLGDAEMTVVVDAVEKGKTECRGQFLVLDVRQGEGSAQQWLLPLEAFSLAAAAASGQGSCESASCEEGTSLGERSCLGAVCCAQFQGCLEKGDSKNAFFLDASFCVRSSCVDSATLQG